MKSFKFVNSNKAKNNQTEDSYPKEFVVWLIRNRPIVFGNKKFVEDDIEKNYKYWIGEIRENQTK